MRSVEPPKYIFASENRAVSGFTISSETYTTEPDIFTEFSDNDMNSLEPIAFDQWNLKPGFRSGWKLLRAAMNIPRSQNPDSTGEFELTISELRASAVRIAVDGKLIYTSDEAHSGRLDVKFKPEQSGKVELRVVIGAGDEPAGIRNGVALRS